MTARLNSISRILIANRGEIAVRIAKTLRRLGIDSVAVYSQADKAALHVQICDQAMPIGGAAPQDSYLNIENIITAAQKSGAQAIHPGYGFLSENADFAKAVEKAGLIFIGPKPETITAMGSKSAAKDLMMMAGVSVTPGYQGGAQDLETFKSEAQNIGYPVLLKASAGGGGKGMRIVTDKTALSPALKAAKLEARSAFGDDHFLLEKYISRARHLEVQIFGDGRGEAVHLFERDCSLQRRHQKIIEEAPAPDLPADIRERLLKAAVIAAKAVNYRGAGTVEFLYDGTAEIYFMEMNTRLQVEHAVTEAITGLDLVEWQILIAQGGALPLQQEQIKAQGHAFEARIYAEDPNNNFTPSMGTLEHVIMPDKCARIDTGIIQGQIITPFYDPMIAKIITHGDSRTQALTRLSQALKQSFITGVETNIGFLLTLTNDPPFRRGDVSTDYIDDHKRRLFAHEDISQPALCAFALHRLIRHMNGRLGFRLNAPSKASFWVHYSGHAYYIELSEDDGSNTAMAEEGVSCFILKAARHNDAADRRAGCDAHNLPPCHFTGTLEPDGYFKLIIAAPNIHNTQNICGKILPHCEGLRVFIDNQYLDIADFDPRLGPVDNHEIRDDALNAPMPGQILALHVNIGDLVRTGDVLGSMEAMKMEHSLRAPFAGRVSALPYAVGDQVKAGACLFEIDADREPEPKNFEKTAQYPHPQKGKPR